MPLSEDEQRILYEIEQQLYESDPALAREVSSTTVYTESLRNLRWSVVLFVVGVGIMLFTLSAHYLYAFGGFLVMLAAALMFVKNLRRLGTVGLQQLTTRLSTSGMRNALGGAGDRMKTRFRRDDEVDDDQP